MIDIKALTEKSGQKLLQGGTDAFLRFSPKLERKIAKAIRNGSSKLELNYPRFLRRRYRQAFYDALKKWAKENEMSISSACALRKDYSVEW